MDKSINVGTLATILREALIGKVVYVYGPDRRLSGKMVDRIEAEIIDIGTPNKKGFYEVALIVFTKDEGLRSIDFPPGQSVHFKNK